MAVITDLYILRVIITGIIAVALISIFSISFLYRRLRREVVRQTIELSSSNRKLSLQIEKRKEIEKALRKSEETFRVFVESAIDGILSTDIYGNIVFANDAAQKIFDYSHSEILGKHISFLVPETLRKDLDLLIETVIKYHEKYTSLVATMLKKGNESFPVEISVNLLKDDEKFPTGILAVIRDISQRKREQDALLQSEKRFRAVYEKAPMGIAIVDTKSGRHIHVNPKYCMILGYTEEEILNVKTHDIIYPEDFEREKKFMDRLFSGELKDFSLEKRFLSKTGEVISVLSAFVALWEEEMQSKVHLTIIEDVTEQKQAEKEKCKLEVRLRQSQKMEAIGTLAGGIAHDFNNILSAILGYSEMTLEHLEKDDPIYSYVYEINLAGERAKDLVTQILTFSRRKENILQPTAVHLVLKEGIRLLRSSIPANIEIRQNIRVDCPFVLADSTQIHQLIMNLGTNAYQAMREAGGVLEVSLETVDIKNRITDQNVQLEKGRYVKLTVSDTGSGIPSSCVERIFEPYFTMRKKGEGTGLGLAIVHGIVKSLCGEIIVESNTGKGARFNIYLPAITKKNEETGYELSTVMIPTGRENVLIVDDDERIVNINKTMLESLGYKVTTMTSSMETLDTFHKKPNAFDLVITDMGMPKLTGAALARHLLAIRPEIPIILCTGFSDLIDAEKALGLGISDFIMKPVLKKDMAVSVREVLDRAKQKEKECWLKDDFHYAQ